MNFEYTDTQKIKILREYAEPLNEAGDDYASLIHIAEGAKIVMLGESTHGTHEFYRERAQISKLLISKLGFNGIAIEGDWPDAWRVHRYVTADARSEFDDKDAENSLRGFTRFPSWLWANADMVNLIGWLRDENDQRKSKQREAVGFYGLDLYSMFKSTHEVITYLDKIDSDAAERARQRFACLTHYGSDSQKYSYNIGVGLSPSCEDTVAAQLADLLKSALIYRKHNGGFRGIEEFFNAEQNNRLVAAAEHYYRSLMKPGFSSWNLRDRHMLETIERIMEHNRRLGHDTKLIVWAHNSHVGDARATDRANHGEISLGQIAREAFGPDVLSIGFTTASGTVLAAKSWNDQPIRETVRIPREGSYESLFQRANIRRFFLDMREENEARKALTIPMMTRAIGVIYRPENERLSHYYTTCFPRQFDAVIHIDQTRAVEPVEHLDSWAHGTEAPESFPTGL